MVVIMAALAFITIRWEAVELSLHPLKLSIQWGQILPNQLSSWGVLISTLVAVILANCLYPRLTRLNLTTRPKFCLILSVCGNLGLLGFFKYFNFFIGSISSIIQSFGAEPDFVYLHVILPVGISFYTFQSMSYTIDIYRQKLEPTKHFFDFALLVSFFPQLVAGPIERASHLLPQLTKPRHLQFEQSTRGLFLILFGLFKKVAIADSIAKSVNAIYNTRGSVSWADIVLATLLFTAQIYCDFSGYTDIARGVAKILGVELMTNFNLPYFSKTASEFWQRWHISLSTWLRDYLYIPLGGNRKGELRTYINLMITMILGGLWHGAAWNFVFWGLYQGILLCLYRYLENKLSIKGFSPFWNSVLATFFFFILTCYGWLLFRANSLEQVVSFTTILITNVGDFNLSIPKPSLSGLLGLPVLIIYEIIENYFNNTHFYLRFRPVVKGAFYAILMTMILMGVSNEPQQFIYFQF
ncbi:acyltransferase [Aphanothece sacrum FPU1]|uniref:Acyltransferase n=2 Tax=Aphanothece sacrum TaxID=1122 RepID=A0A401IHH8_APHSA|nr:acyltransferase [Aphanothece sacrum FPU1]